MKSRCMLWWASLEDMYLNANIIGLLEAAFEPQLAKVGEEFVMSGMGRAEMIVVSFSLFLGGGIFVLEREGLRGEVKTK